MQSDLVKLCPRCGSEYQMWVERCLDCDTVLVHGLEGQGAGTQALPEGLTVEEGPDVPPGTVHLRTSAVDWIRRLSEDLDAAGIRHWTTPPVWRRDPSLFVLPEDLDAAARVDRARYEIEVPEVAPEDARPQTPVRRREAASNDMDVKVCPSCGGEYQLWAETCADCGVRLVRPWDLDSARESAVPKAVAPVASASSAASEDSGACPACGERLAEGAVDCPGCGLMLAQPEVCPKCGVDLDAWVSSCRRCGFEFFGMTEG